MSDPISITLVKKIPTVTTVGRGLRGYSTLIRVSDGGVIRWRQNYETAPWNDIIPLSDLIGPQGTAAHVHIKWHAEGAEVLLDEPDAYIGIYADNTAADSTVYADYQWFKYKGDKGDTGDAAPNTIWQYSADGTTWTTSVPDGVRYMRESTDNGATWSTAVELPSVAALALKAPLASPALTGIPTAPTAAQGTDTTQLATCSFVNSATMEGDPA